MEKARLSGGHAWNGFIFHQSLLPYCVMSNSPSQLGSRFLSDILGICRNSQVISHYSNSVHWKIPISFLLQNFPFQHHGPGSSPLTTCGRGVACLSSPPTPSSPVSPGQDWLAGLWTLSSSHFPCVLRWGARKKGKEQLSLTWLNLL